MDWRCQKVILCALLGLVLSAASAAWAEDLSLQITPMLRHITVDGDEDKFREDNWRDDGWAGGVENFEARYGLGEATEVDVRGHALFGEQDYGFRIDLEREAFGWIRAGYSEYRKYFDDTGGFYAPFSPPAFDLNRDLNLDIGQLYIETRLTLPDWPEFGIGYEHLFRDGEKTLLHWGGVTQEDTTRNIFPSYEGVDETVDIWTAEVSHSFKGFFLEDQFRYEHYSRDTTRYEQERNLTDGTSEQVIVFNDGSHDALFNTFFAENRFPHRLYVSLGYLYSELDGDAEFAMTTVPFGPEPFDKNWSADPIDLDRDSHVVNLSAMAGPYKELTFYGGLEGELTDTDGDAAAVLEEIAFSGEEEAPVARIRTREDLDGIKESAGVRYTGISYTTLYAEGEFRQQQIDLDEQEIEDGELGFARATDTDVTRERYTVGFNTSPFSRTTFTAMYRKSYRDNDFDHDLDTTEGGYSAFITEQEYDIDELSARIAWRPLGWLKSTFEYKLVNSDIDTRTDTDPPATIRSGNYQADIYSVSFLLTPVSRFYLSSLFSYRDIRSEAYDNGAASVVAFVGDSFTSVNSLNYIFDDQTDIRVEYSFSRTNNFNDNSANGLPLLHDYRLHRLVSTLTRKVSENMDAMIRYGFYEYKEDVRNDIDGYSAHLVGVALEFKL